jgi:hypothetical protein
MRNSTPEGPGEDYRMQIGFHIVEVKSNLLIAVDKIG